MMFGLRGLIASCLLASALASPHLISTEVSGPRIGKTRGLKGAGIRRDSLLFSREPGAPMVRRNGLVARTDSKTLSFEQTLEDQVIFNSTGIPLFPGPSLAVSCVKCCSKGGVEATYPGDIEDVVNPKFRVDLQDIEVYVEVDVVVSDSNQFSIPLLPFLPGLTGINIPGFKAGLFIDLLLVIQISGEADLRGGFYVKIPKGSFFEIDISEDADTSQEFTDVISKALPVTINNDDTGIEFKAALQLKAEFGLTASTATDGDDFSIPGIGGVDLPGVDLPNFGAGAIVGAFVNLVEYIANVAPEDDCALEATQELNVNMGVFAKVGVNIDEEFLGLRPSATTTLLTLPLPTACFLETGLPVPTREAPLPVAGECKVDAAASVNDDEDEEPIVVTDSSTPPKSTTAPPEEPTQAKITAAPSVVSTESPKKRADSNVKELTAFACASQVTDCPDELQTTVTYKTTLCDAPVKTGSCFAISDAETLDPTSVVNTKAPATTTATANEVRADNDAGRGTGTNTRNVPEETTAEQENTSADSSEVDSSDEDSCDEDSPEESAKEDSTEGASPDSPVDALEDGSDEDGSDASMDGSSAVTPSALLSAASSGSPSSAAPTSEPTEEPEPEVAPPQEGPAQTGSGSRLLASTMMLSVAGSVAWVLV